MSLLSSHVGVPVPLGEVVYCDDEAIPVITSSDMLVDKVGLIIQVARVIFSSFGRMLNFGNNQTNVLPYFVGPGSQKAKQELSANNYKCNVMFNDRLFELLFVNGYKHLGTNFSVSNDLKQEVSCSK